MAKCLFQPHSWLWFLDLSRWTAFYAALAATWCLLVLYANVLTLACGHNAMIQAGKGGKLAEFMINPVSLMEKSACLPPEQSFQKCWQDKNEVSYRLILHSRAEKRNFFHELWSAVASIRFSSRIKSAATTNMGYIFTACFRTSLVLWMIWMSQVPVAEMKNPGSLQKVSQSKICQGINCLSEKHLYYTANSSANGCTCLGFVCVVFVCPFTHSVASRRPSVLVTSGLRSLYVVILIPGPSFSSTVALSERNSDQNIQELVIRRRGGINSYIS